MTNSKTKKVNDEEGIQNSEIRIPDIEPQILARELRMQQLQYRERKIEIQTPNADFLTFQFYSTKRWSF